jgi:hypothetical protein
MQLWKTMRFGLAALMVAGTLAMFAPRAEAQFGGGGQMPPGIAEKIKKWQKFREDHKKVQQLGDLVYQVGEMNKDPNTALDKNQATKMLAIIKPLRNKKTMSEDEAGKVIKDMTAMLNTKQIKKMTTIETPSQRMARGGFGGGGRPGGGGPGGGGGRPGGGGPGGGGRPGGFTFPDPPKEAWNPFNPDSLPFEQARPRAKASMNEFMSTLEKRSKG